MTSLHAYLLTSSRLILMGMYPLTMLSSSLPQCIDTSSKEKSICLMHSSTSIKITAGEYVLQIDIATANNYIFVHQNLSKLLVILLLLVYIY